MDENIKILVVATGGTICSVTGKDGLNDVSGEKSVLGLISMYEDAYNDHGVDFDVIHPIDTLSENMTIDKWDILIKELSDVDYRRYSGVIVLHGTDTLHMTAPLLGILMRNVSCPVILVAANRVLSDPESNGFNNFSKSIQFIETTSTYKRVLGEPFMDAMEKVLVIYRNLDGVTYVHSALELEECPTYSDDFSSCGMQSFENYISGFINYGSKQTSDSGEAADDFKDYPDITKGGVSPLMGNVIYIKPYTGINFSRFSLDGVDKVLLGLYHAQTVNTEGEGDYSAISLLRRCKENGTELYIYPCDKDGFRYSSTKRLLDEGAKTLFEGTWNLNYISLMLAGNVR